jgi:hypothetical protein
MTRLVMAESGGRGPLPTHRLPSGPLTPSCAERDALSPWGVRVRCAVRPVHGRRTRTTWLLSDQPFLRTTFSARSRAALPNVS